MEPLHAAAAGLLAATMPSLADTTTFESESTPAALVELYTSEGCSSCPPADAWVSKLKTHPDLWRRIVPVVFHVDYWNGLGWPDRFANAANTARQRRYAAAWRSDTVYTPGFVLNGREWRDWARGTAFPDTNSARAGKLAVTLDDKTAHVVFTPEGAAPKTLHLELALLGSNLESDVQRGENGGRKLRHDFTVLYFATTPLRASGGHLTATLPLPERASDAPSALAAWVTPGDAQPPLQATGGWLPKR